MRYLSILMILVFVFGCGYQKEIDQLTAENEKLSEKVEEFTEQSSLKDEFISEYTRTVNEVYDNLENIRKREGFITRYSKQLEDEAEPTLRDRMLDNLASMDAYIQSSKSQLNSLRARLKDSNLQMQTLAETIEKLQQTVEEKETHIVQLKEEIDQLNTRVVNAEQQIAEKDQQIAEKTKSLNTAYYVIGTNDELKEKQIIQETGGLFGIGKTKIISSKLNEQQFNPTDISTTALITIEQKLKDIKIISPHNPDSYHLVAASDEQTQLEIIDPNEFWKMKYLVILAKN